MIQECLGHLGSVPATLFIFNKSHEGMGFEAYFFFSVAS